MKTLLAILLLFPVLAFAQSRVIISDDGTNGYWGTVALSGQITNNQLSVTLNGLS